MDIEILERIIQYAIRDFVSVVIHFVCTQVLCDSTSFFCNNVRFADVIEESRLTMINMTHDDNHGGALRKRRFLIFGLRH